MPGGPINSQTIYETEKVGDNGYRLLRRKMDSTGDGTGTKEMATTVDEYFISPASTEDIIINTIRIILMDDGDFPWDEFAALGSSLSNGILFKMKENTSSGISDLKDLMDNSPIQQNSDFLSLGNVSTSIDPSGLSILSCDIDFRKLLGYPIRLKGPESKVLSFEVQDDFSNLTSLVVWVQGLVGKTSRA